MPPPEAFCALCGRPGPFPPLFPGASLRESRCPGCRSSRRARDLARVLLAECGLEASRPLARRLGELRAARIHEFQARGALHEALRGLPGYSCSEYFPDLPSGACNPQGVLCQDAARLSFADASLDMAVSQDVLEHMPDPWSGFAEIARVLRPGGRHIFTVPLHEGKKTRPRARLVAGGDREHLLPPLYHKDPLNADGALVFWDFGEDLPDLLRSRGIAARVALHAAFYPSEALCRVDDEADLARCRETLAARGHAAFFLYNSVVFVAEKGLSA